MNPDPPPSRAGKVTSFDRTPPQPRHTGRVADVISLAARRTTSTAVVARSAVTHLDAHRLAAVVSFPSRPADLLPEPA